MPRIKNERKSVLISFLKEEYEEYFNIQKSKGYASFNECIRMLCKAGASKVDPTYVRELKLRAEKTKIKDNQSPEEKIKEELERQDLRDKVKTEKKLNEGRARCSLLGGTEVLSEGNVPHCEYHTYIENNDRQSVRGVYNKCPIEDLKDWDVENQYQDFVNQRGPEITKRLKELPIVK